jgi:hypothetical protein
MLLFPAFSTELGLSWSVNASCSEVKPVNATDQAMSEVRARQARLTVSGFQATIARNLLGRPLGEV